MNHSPRKSVVIVDDDVAYTRLLSQLLVENLDCPIVAFSRPRAALAALPNLSAGLIVSDYEMPELNGFEFLAEAAKLAPEVPCILITGHVIDGNFEKRVQASPARTVLTKPFSWRKLSAEIMRHWPEAGLRAQPASV